MTPEQREIIEDLADDQSPHFIELMPVEHEAVRVLLDERNTLLAACVALRVAWATDVDNSTAWEDIRAAIDRAEGWSPAPVNRKPPAHPEGHVEGS